MKKREVMGRLVLPVCTALLLSACGEKAEAAEEERGRMSSEASSGKEEAEEVPAAEEENGAGEEVAEAPAEEEKEFHFATEATDRDRLIRDAQDQYNANDYTPLEEPVEYNVLWLGFTHVTYDDLDFQMTDADREYLEAVALNFEKSVESITDHNLDINVDLHFVEDAVELTRADADDWLYLAKGTAQPWIDQFTADQEIDTVLTTVQTEGEENQARNEGKNGYGVNYVMTGLETDDLTSLMGYSTFHLGMPKEGTYPLEDPEIPSLYATAVAVHEWMHQFECLKTLLEIEYPSTHAYMGPDAFPGYQEYIADKNDYDFFEFYKLVLTGKLPYDDGVSTTYVGMYPKMWPLVKRDFWNFGEYTIEAADGSGFMNGRDTDPRLYIASNACEWNIRYNGNRHFTLTPVDLPDLRIDLGNAWDNEDNTIGLWVYTGYFDAQTWYLDENKDGSYSIRTPYPSGRLLTINGSRGATLNTRGADGVQDWIFTPVE